MQAAVPFYGAYDLANVLDTKAGDNRLDYFLARTVFKTTGSRGLRKRDTVAAGAVRMRRRSSSSTARTTRSSRWTKHASSRDGLRDVSKEPVVYAELPGAQHAFDVFHSIRSAHVIRGVERFLRWVHATRDVSTPV